MGVFSLLQWVKVCVLALLSAFFVYPVVLVVLIPVIVYRFLIQCIVKLTDPTCGKMLTGISAVLTGPRPYDKFPIIGSPYILYSEHVDINRVKKIVDETLIQPNSYTEMKQRIVRKLGYYFWRNVEDFDLSNHIKYLYPECPDKPILKSELRSFKADDIIYGPFDKRYSPWQLVLVPNLFDPDDLSVKSAIVFRVAHCLMDGISAVKLFQKTSPKPWNWPIAKTLATQSDKQPFYSKTKRILTACKIMLTGPYHVINMFLNVNDTSEFIRKAVELKDNEETVWVQSTCDPRHIEMKRLERIRKNYNVGMASVMTTILVEGVCKFIRTKCDNGYSKLPTKLILQLVVPLPGHPDSKLVNHWSFVRIPIKLNKCSDPVQTAKWIHARYQSLAGSIEPALNYLISLILGLLPIWTQPNLNKSKLRQTLLLTNLPGPQSDANIFGYDVVDWGLVGNGPTGTAIGSMIRTIYEKCRIEAGGTTALFSTQDDIMLANKCIQSIVEKLDNPADESLFECKSEEDIKLRRVKLD